MTGHYCIYSSFGTAVKLDTCPINITPITSQKPTQSKFYLAYRKFNLEISSEKNLVYKITTGVHVERYFFLYLHHLYAVLWNITLLRSISKFTIFVMTDSNILNGVDHIIMWAQSPSSHNRAPKEPSFLTENTIKYKPYETNGHSLHKGINATRSI